MSNPAHLAPPDADVEAGQSSDRDNETSALLQPAQPSYRRRRVSESIVVQQESYRTRWWTGVAGGAVALTILIVGGGLVALRPTHGGKHGDKVDDTPDFSKLPGPQPGLRNSNYLVSGVHGGVATEVDVCSEIGVEGSSRKDSVYGAPADPAPTAPVLKDGGTATDAAIASALCIGVTNSFSSGIGGCVALLGVRNGGLLTPTVLPAAAS